ncbi:uncharacterized protein LOC101451187 [Ceratitis capitata]|uniref:L antigen family member 3 n=1 Tax=Ceratitis capitata TaxID=7213 RepID=W8CCG3_CERCA|nr:uncharacterized protein LOC101451187 [Ceratitis capitata]
MPNSNVLESDTPTENINNQTEATLKIPFENSQRAEIVYRVLSVDKEPRRNFVQKELRLIGNQIEIHFKADQVKNLRTAITSFFGALLLCTDTIKEFAPNTQTVNNNGGTHTSANSA